DAQKRRDRLYLGILRIRTDRDRDESSADAEYATLECRRSIERYRGLQITNGVVVEERSRVRGLDDRGRVELLCLDVSDGGPVLSDVAKTAEELKKDLSKPAVARQTQRKSQGDLIYFGRS